MAENAGLTGDDPARRIGDHDAFLRAGEHDRGLPQLGFIALALGDVVHDGRETGERSVLVMDRRCAEEDVEERSVLAPPHRLDCEAFARNDTVEDSVRSVGMPGRDQEAGRTADRLRGGVAEQTFGALVPGRDAPVGRDAHDGVLRGLHDRGEARVGELRRLAFRDVGDRADHAQRAPIGTGSAVLRPYRYRQPSHGAVAADDAVLDVPQFAATRCVVARDRSHERGAIVLVDLVEDALQRERLILGEIHQAAQEWRCIELVGEEVVVEQAEPRHVDREAQALLADGERVLGPPAFGDVGKAADHAQGTAAGIALDHVATIMNPDVLAVAAAQPMLADIGPVPAQADP